MADGLHLDFICENTPAFPQAPVRFGVGPYGLINMYFFCLFCIKVGVEWGVAISRHDMAVCTWVKVLSQKIANVAQTD
jgi:hypothetical protein